METRATRRGRVAESLKALEAARAKREHRAEEAVRDQKAAAGPPPEDRPRREPRAEVKLAAAVVGPGGRAVNSGSSRRAVSRPTRIASTRPRSPWTIARDGSSEIQRLEPVWVAILPSSVIAHLAMIHGRPVPTSFK